MEGLWVLDLVGLDGEVLAVQDDTIFISVQARRVATCVIQLFTSRPRELLTLTLNVRHTHGSLRCDTVTQRNATYPV